jgi:GTP cyclohydrolase IB
LRDIASEPDTRGIAIRRVGIRDLSLPLLVAQKEGGHTSVCATIDMSVGLPHTERGTHMSRFVELLGEWQDRPFGRRQTEQILGAASARFEAAYAHIAVRFKYFVEKLAPRSRVPFRLDYDCLFEGDLDGGGFLFHLGVEVPVLTLCPCSKEISARGAHSQRAIIRARIQNELGHKVWIEDLVALLEAQGSQPVYPLLKRADEQAVTEGAYDNPKFVEDVVRDAVLALKAVAHVPWFCVECESFESIHNHNAYAYYETPRGAP